MYQKPAPEDIGGIYRKLTFDFVPQNPSSDLKDLLEVENTCSDVEDKSKIFISH